MTDEEWRTIADETLYGVSGIEEATKAAASHREARRVEVQIGFPRRVESMWIAVRVPIRIAARVPNRTQGPLTWGLRLPDLHLVALWSPYGP